MCMTSIRSLALSNSPNILLIISLVQVRYHMIKYKLIRMPAFSTLLTTMPVVLVFNGGTRFCLPFCVIFLAVHQILVGSVFIYAMILCRLLSFLISYDMICHFGPKMVFGSGSLGLLPSFVIAFLWIVLLIICGVRGEYVMLDLSHLVVAAFTAVVIISV